VQTCVFTKSFQDLDAPALARVMAGLGVAGVDLTVRGGGHVEPAKVREDLPRFRDALGEKGLKISMFTTEITDAGRPHACEVIEAAAKAGVKFIKLGYWTFRGWGHLAEQEAEVGKSLAGLEPVLIANGVTAGYHTHSGDWVGPNAGHVYHLIKDRNPKAFGVYYDIGHCTLEGGVSAWKLDLERAAERVVMVAVKNMSWVKNESGKGRAWTWRVVPLNEGLADIPAFVKLLTAMKFAGPLSFHSEYQGEWSFRDLKGEALVEQTKKDIDWFKGLM